MMNQQERDEPLIEYTLDSIIAEIDGFNRP